MNYNNMKRSELTEQIRLFEWARRHQEYITELKLLHHIPNEGKRTNGNLLKAAGLKAGIPDVFLPVARKGYIGLYIEMKYDKNKPSKEQEEVMAMLRAQGYKVSVCYGYEQAREIIRHYLARAEGFDLVICEETLKQWNKCDGVAKNVMPNSPCNQCSIYKNYGGC